MRAAATVQRAVRLDVARGETEDALRRLEAVGDHAVAAGLLADEGPTLLLRGHGGAGARVRRRAPLGDRGQPRLVVRGRAGALVRRRRRRRAAQWLERILHDPQPDTELTVLQQACARVMRARLGLEPIGPRGRPTPSGSSPTPS